MGDVAIPLNLAATPSAPAPSSGTVWSARMPYNVGPNALPNAVSAAANTAGLGSMSGDITTALGNRLTTESGFNPATGTGLYPGVNPNSSAMGIGQQIISASNSTGGVTYTQNLQAGLVPPAAQLAPIATQYVQSVAAMNTAYAGLGLTPAQIVALGDLGYANGVAGAKDMISAQGGAAALRANPAGTIAAVQAASQARQVAIAHGGASYAGPAQGYVPTGPSAEAAVAQRPLLMDNGGNAVSPDEVIWSGLNNTPWWRLEGLLVGNPNLRRIPDAVKFMIALPPRDAGNYLTTTQGGSEKVIIRLNVGLTSLGQASAHQNTTEATGSGILVNLWNSRPDMITASGTTGVFMNQFGLTSMMSCSQSPWASEFFEALSSMSIRNNPVNNPNGLRVAAQDAFMELWALFKNNGLIRYTNPQSMAGANVLMANASTNLSGYQMRYRVGDVMKAGLVAMVYKGRTMLGQFKTFELTANADSPFRWDFSFTFRVLSDFVPYTVFGN